jgi:hypothetical protein
VIFTDNYYRRVLHFRVTLSKTLILSANIRLG